MKFFYLACLLCLLLAGTVTAGPLDTWQWRNPLPQGNDLSAIAFGNGLYAAAGAEGTVLTSPDGSSWTIRSSGITSDIYGISAANGRFVAVGEGGAVLISADGASWRQGVAGTSSTLYSVAYGFGKYLAAGGRTLIASIDDGATWTAARGNLDASFSANALSLCNGTFVIVGEGGRILTSSDGSTWIERPSGTTERLSRLACGNGVMVVQASSMEKFLVSTTDETWTKITLTGIMPNMLAFAGDRFFISTSSMLLSSTDGMHWTETKGNIFEPLRAMAYGGGTWLGVGSGGVIMASGDSASWSTKSSGQKDKAGIILHGNGRFIYLGDRGMVKSSIDGISWAEHAPGGGGSGFRAAAYGNGNYVAAWGLTGIVLCTGGCDYSSRLYTSKDGITWKAQSLADFKDIGSIAFGNGMFVAAGKNTLLTSTDGLTWAKRSPGTTAHLMAVHFANGLFFISATETDSSSKTHGYILTSQDGSAWTLNSLNDSAVPQAIAYGAGMYVGVGEYGRVYRSADGAAWTRGVSGISGDLWDVIFENGVFVAAGRYGVLLTSRDGLTWERKNAGTGNPLGQVMYHDGRFIAYGRADGTILQSGDMCNGMLESDLSLSLPTISFNGSFLWADLEFVPSSGLFKVTNAGAFSQSDCAAPASLTVTSNSLSIHIPTLTYAGMKLWADLEYVPTTDGQILFRVSNAGSVQ